jgi:hypothetical protein
MHYRHMHRGGGRCGPGFRRRRYPDRAEWLHRLEEYQKDLEQEVADVADLIRRLREEQGEKPAGETATV